jgi:hypothetical protein
MMNKHHDNSRKVRKKPQSDASQVTYHAVDADIVGAIATPLGIAIAADLQRFSIIQAPVPVCLHVARPGLNTRENQQKNTNEQ